MQKTIENNIVNNVNIGLTSTQAAERLAVEGKNVLAEKKKTGAVKLFLGQFRDVMVMILLASTVISVLLGEITDAVTIIIIVLLNAVLGFVQEYKTEKTLEALSRMTAPTAKCYRDGKLRSVPAAELVIGDVIELEAGDKVPADCELLSAKGLLADEAVLTGEAVPIEKKSAPPLADNRIGQSGAVYSGTIITKGKARCRIIATGMNSQIGRISAMLSDINEEKTPLQKRLAELGKWLAVLCIAVCLIVFAAGVIRGENVFGMLMTAISIAIAAIPEGLPATVTIALALAVSRMLKQKALVNKLHSVETLGCTSVICTDKTGTITENKMTVEKLFCGMNEFDVTGSGYRIGGEIRLDKEVVNPKQLKPLEELLNCAVLCGNAEISTEKEIVQRRRGSLNDIGEWKTIGDPTETALLVAAAKGGVTAKSLKTTYRITDEIPFDSETKCMTVKVSSSSGMITSITKGPPDVVLSKCTFVESSGGAIPLTDSLRREIVKTVERYADSALRVLGFAKKDGGGDYNMTFLGLAGMIDPPRAEAKRAVRICSKAHIKTVMITGDHKNTAAAVARQAGILQGNAEGRVITGAELECMTDEELSDCIENIRVFARVNPSDKLRIVRAFKSRGHIVTMTGDGVNDAPAVKEAHIGVSMGITGTDVTKQAADVILLDDNFATLVSAVGQGRGIYANIRKFVRYLLSCNIGEVMTMFAGIMMGFPLVLLPTQILLVNLVTDGLPAVALGVEPPDDSVMKKRPRKPDESFFANGLTGTIIFRGIMIGICTLGCFAIISKMGGSIAAARTGALFTLVMSQLLHVFECKSEEKNIFTVSYLNNPKLIFAVLISTAVIFAAIYFPPLTVIFSTVPLNIQQLVTAFMFSAAIPLVSAVIPKSSG